MTPNPLRRPPQLLLAKGEYAMYTNNMYRGSSASVISGCQSGRCRGAESRNGPREPQRPEPSHVPAQSHRIWQGSVPYRQIESRQKSIEDMSIMTGHGRAASRTLTRTDRLLSSMKTWGIMPESAVIGSSMLRDDKSGVFFPEVTWQDSSGTVRRHWLRMRAPLYAQDVAPRSIQFVSGTCLFGRSGATMNLANGSRWPLISNRLSLPSPIKSVSIRDGLSFYELDTACRLSSVISSLVERCTRPTRIFVHIPRPEYVLVMLGHRRLPSVEWSMKDWLDAVERRGDKAGEFFQTLLADKPSDRLDIGSPLDATLLPYLRDSITQGKTPTPRELSGVIRESGGALSELFAHWLRARRCTRDPDYYDLAYFGYVAGIAVNLADSSLAVEVDNPSEEPIFRALARVMRGARENRHVSRGNAMAIYPSEEIAQEVSPDRQLAPDCMPNEELRRSLVTHYGLTAEQN